MLIFKAQNYFLLKIALINKRFTLKYKINLSNTLPGTWKTLLFTWELVSTGFLPSLRSSPLSNAAVKKIKPSKLFLSETLLLPQKSRKNRMPAENVRF